MKNKKSDILLCVFFCGFLFSMFALYLLLPKQEFSEKEKRYLAQAPQLTWETLLSGQFGQDAETYLADHIPGRDLWVGMASYYDLATNRQVAKEVDVARGDRFVEPPIVWDQAVVDKNMKAINAFADALGRPVDLMLVPSAGFVLQDSVIGLHDPYSDDAIIRDVYAMAGSNVVCRDMVGVYQNASNKEALYYRTDHHWTSLGAYTAYSAYMDLLGRDHPAADSFTVERHSGFLGSTYSRSGLWLTPAEDVELWKNSTAFTVTNGDSDAIHNGLFYEERLEELDKYTVYLDGNHSTVRIENPDKKGQGKLLVIRDSYANCLGTFLANSYETVVLVDLRYYKKPVSELLASEEFTDVLVCYSLGNFMTDTNLIWLR